jgi:hypothetical protein
MRRPTRSRRSERCCTTSTRSRPISISSRLRRKPRTSTRSTTKTKKYEEEEDEEGEYAEEEYGEYDEDEEYEEEEEGEYEDDPTWLDRFELCPRRAFVDGDPLFTQAEMLSPEDSPEKRLAGYGTLFTYATRMGKADCTVPDAGRSWIGKTPVVSTRRWSADVPPSPSELSVSNVLNWSAWSDVLLNGSTYGHKSRSFEPFLDLPARVRGKLVLAAGGPAPKAELREHGWTLVDPLEATSTIRAYRDFIARSKADFGIAKHAYVASRSGWFSDRSTCYLAGGRPVLHQDTGFTDWLPSGEGVLAFSTLDDVVAALDELERDYERHARGGAAPRRGAVRSPSRDRGDARRRGVPVAVGMTGTGRRA